MAEFFVDLGDARPDTGFRSSSRSSTSRTSSTQKDQTNDQLHRHHRPARRARRSRSPRGPTATPAPGSRCSARPGPRARVEEKIADAAQVHRFTGLAPSVALHIPWDHVDDYGKLAAYAEDLGVHLGTINSNTFQDDDYKLGSLAHHDREVRIKAIQHNLDCIEVMNQTGSRDLKIWLADGTNYPGPGRHPLAPGLAGREPRRDLLPDRRGPAAGAGVQVLRAGVLPHRRPGLGHVVRPGGARWGSGPWSASTPATTRPAPTSSSSWPSCCGSGSSARSTSTAGSTPTTT